MGSLGRVMLQAGTFSLILLAWLSLPALARDGPLGPDGLPRATPNHPWKSLSGAPRVDTLSFPSGEVIPAARRALEADRWKIFTMDAARGQIVTTWKPIRHPLLWIFMGKVHARCTVNVSPLGPNRTRVVFHGDLASHRDLKRNPMLGTALRAYAKAARDWVGDVRQDLNDHRRLSAAHP